MGWLITCTVQFTHKRQAAFKKEERGALWYTVICASNTQNEKTQHIEQTDSMQPLPTSNCFSESFLTYVFQRVIQQLSHGRTLLQQDVLNFVANLNMMTRDFYKYLCSRHHRCLSLFKLFLLDTKNHYRARTQIGPLVHKLNHSCGR